MEKGLNSGCIPLIRLIEGCEAVIGDMSRSSMIHGVVEVLKKDT